MKANDSKQSGRPRNYLARHPLMKKGGVHQKSKKAERRAAKQSLARNGVNGYEYADKKVYEVKSLLVSVFNQEPVTPSLL